MNLAPIVLFAFNRPEHTARTLDALSKNELARESDLIVYLDGPRNEADLVLIEKVHQVILSFKGFKSITVNKNSSNVGLAANIITGVTKVINKFGRIIVMEDDLVTSPKFLNYMNDGLNYYSEEKRIWHISGFTEFINVNRPNDSFLLRAMYCWGWATWSDRWVRFERNPEALIDTFTPEMIERFNLDNCMNFWSQVLLNASGKINTWAIFWYASIFKHEGLCLNPYNSYVQNIGFDGSGVHCGEDSFRQESKLLNQHGGFKPPKVIEEDAFALGLIKGYYKAHTPSFSLRVYSALRRRFKLFLEGLNRIK